MVSETVNAATTEVAVRKLQVRLSPSIAVHVDVELSAWVVVQVCNGVACQHKVDYSPSSRSESRYDESPAISEVTIRDFSPSSTAIIIHLDVSIVDVDP